MYEKMSGTFGRHCAFGHIKHYDDRRLRRMAQEAGVFEGMLHLKLTAGARM